MRILCIIDHFGGGGAQRQMSYLASGLRDNGHDVEVFIYYPEQSFFKDPLVVRGIPIHEVKRSQGSPFTVFARLVGLLRNSRYDAIISFLDIPNLYAEAARVFSPSTKLIICERSSYIRERSRILALLKRVLHSLATCVVANSFTQGEWLKSHWWLKHKTRVVRNGTGLSEIANYNLAKGPRDLRLLAVGRIGAEKNALAVIEALHLFERRYGWCPSLVWAGRRDTSVEGAAYWRAIEERLNEIPSLKAKWCWIGESKEVFSLLSRSHALVHAASYEGLPNVICEALAAGRPVIASAVCDHQLLVQEGKTGFLFEPESPDSLSQAIFKMASLASEEWTEYCEQARAFAVGNLSIRRMVGEFEDILSQYCSKSS